MKQNNINGCLLEKLFSSVVEDVAYKLMNVAMVAMLVLLLRKVVLMFNCIT